MIKIKKKQKCTKKCVIKKLKFQDYINCLETAQIESKINHLEKNKICVDSWRFWTSKNKGST